jgi:hypothetical protein
MKEIETMKRQTIYCLLTLAGLALSPFAYYSSATPRPHSANVRQDGQQGQPARSTDAEHPGVGLTKTGPGRLALNYVVKREDGETKVQVLVERGAVKKVTAADARGTRTLKSVKPGAGRAQPCDAAGQTRESLTLEEGQVIDVDACTSGLVALLLPAVQNIREAAGRSKSDDGSGSTRISGGASCTKDKPCCFEDEKLKMRVCWHP